MRSKVRSPLKPSLYASQSRTRAQIVNTLRSQITNLIVGNYIFDLAQREVALKEIAKMCEDEAVAAQLEREAQS